MMIKHIRVIILITGLVFFSSAFSEIHWRLDRAISLFKIYDAVVYGEVRSADVLTVDAEHALVIVKVEKLEVFKGAVAKDFCYVSQYEIPARGYPVPHSRLVIGVRELHKDSDCYKQEAGAVVPDDSKILALMRAMRDLNQ